MKYIRLWLENPEIPLFYLLIFFLPFNIEKYLGRLASNNFNFESAFLYLWDILIIAILSIIIVKRLSVIKKLFWQKESLVFVGFALSSLSIFLNGANIRLGLFWYYFSRIFLAYTVFIMTQTIIKNRLFNLVTLGKIFILSMIFQCFFIIGQFSIQKSLLGRFLGESNIGPLITNVAKVDLDTLRYIRGYGMFPHPNVAALYLLIAIILLISFDNDNQREIKRYLNYSALGILLVGLFLTFSRVAIILNIMSVFISLIYLKKFRVLVYFLLFTIVFSYLMWGFFSARFFYDLKSSFNLRVFLNETAIRVIKNNIYIGVGLGHFIENIKPYAPLAGLEPFMLEPVPNIYLLVLTETGLIGFAFLMLFIFMIFKRCFWLIKKRKDIVFPLIFISILIIGFFDHYFITLPQGQIILTLTSGIILSKK